MSTTELIDTKPTKPLITADAFIGVLDALLKPLNGWDCDVHEAYLNNVDPVNRRIMDGFTESVIAKLKLKFDMDPADEQTLPARIIETIWGCSIREAEERQKKEASEKAQRKKEIEKILLTKEIDRSPGRKSL